MKLPGRLLADFAAGLGAGACGDSGRATEALDDRLMPVPPAGWSMPRS